MRLVLTDGAAPTNDVTSWIWDCSPTKTRLDCRSIIPVIGSPWCQKITEEGDLGVNYSIRAVCRSTVSVIENEGQSNLDSR